MYIIGSGMLEWMTRAVWYKSTMMDTLPIFPAHVRYVAWDNGGMHLSNTSMESVKWWKCHKNCNKNAECSVVLANDCEESASNV